MIACSARQCEAVEDDEQSDINAEDYVGRGGGLFRHRLLERNQIPTSGQQPVLLPAFTAATAVS
jgi:hypothetical protein